MSQTATLALPLTGADLRRLLIASMAGRADLVPAWAQICAAEGTDRNRLLIELACPSPKAVWVRTPMGGPSKRRYMHGGRRHGHLAPDQEARFMEELQHAVDAGDSALTAGGVRMRLEQKVGHAVSHMAVLRLLRRHGWVRVRSRKHRAGGRGRVQP